MEINPKYAETAQKVIKKNGKVICGDFFLYDWGKEIASMSEPALIIGNPPWVTNSELKKLNSANLPYRYNLHNFNGIDAITGKSNFDISEWMLIKELQWLQGKNGAMAMLCKTGIARKVMLYAWKKGLKITEAEIRNLDAKHWFDVSVDACLLFISVDDSSKSDNPCFVYKDLAATSPEYILGLRHGRPVSNVDLIDANERLIAKEQDRYFIWRSGIKHDCAKVMELKILEDSTLVNGFGDVVEIENDLLYPMLKSSDIANGDGYKIKRMMLVTQKFIGGNTKYIQHELPKTWRYLQQHSKSFSERKSGIYQNKPQFAIFGVGDYSFAPWKLAISGLYKKLNFKIIGAINNKPIVLDDTCYFLPCYNKEQALAVKRVLDSDLGFLLLNACVFWDSKRPITKDVLSLPSIPSIAKELGLQHEIKLLFPAIFQKAQLKLL